MSFSLRFWRKKTEPTTQPPGLPGKPAMPFVRDEPKPEPHPRLQRMAEVIASLPKQVPPDAHAAAHTHEASHPSAASVTEAIHQASHTPHPAHAEHTVPFAHVPVMEPQKTTATFWEPPTTTETPVVVETVPVPHHVVAPEPFPIAREEYIPFHHTEKFTAFSERPVAVNLHERATNAFYASDGGTYWTLNDFGDALVSMHDGTFAYHVNNERNDFASWIEGCFGEPNKSFGTSLRGLSRESIIRLFLDARGLPTVHARPVDRAPAPVAVVPSPAYDEPVHHDDKQPVVVEWRPAASHERSAIVSGILEDLAAARMEAAVDLGGAREHFIATRTRVWSMLSEDERNQVLPKLRDTYEYLRSIR